MDVLLRELRSSGGGVERHDTEFSGDRIVLGSAPDANVQLLGAGIAARHAVITREGGRLQLRCARDCRVRHNGVEETSAQLTIGDTLEIAGNRVTLQAAPAGFDLAFEIQTDPHVDSSQFEQAFQTSIEQAWISKRKLSWLALVLVLAVGFAIPLAGVLLRDHTTPALPFVPSDQLWSSGELASAHAQSAGTQCASCHRELFSRVRDTECRECHESVVDHVHTDRAAMVEMGAQRCATCHREHGSSAQLVPQTDRSCTDCHGDAETRFAALKLPNVEAFEPGQHPPFAARLNVPTEGAAGAVQWRQVKTQLAGAREQSNLKFTHKDHLEAGASGGKGMSCNDCHRAMDDERFAPITMENTCISCHELSFDPDNSARQLPHGEERGVILALQEYFARRYSDPSAAPKADEMPEMRLRPGSNSRTRVCTDPPLICARQSAQKEIEIQFSNNTSGCGKCHEVSDTQAADIYARYKVLPVRLSADYFPTARFDHTSHRTLKDEGGKILTGDAACLNCHAASTSEFSADLLLPDEARCLTCHRAQPARIQTRLPPDSQTTLSQIMQISSPCATCHTYHPHRLVTSSNIGPGSSP